MARRARRAAPRAVAARRGRVDADHHVADAGGDGRGRVLDVDLVARAARHGRLGEDGVDAEVLGEGDGRVGVADAVDVGQRQPGVLEGAEDHGHLELAPAAVELAGGGDVVGDADDAPPRRAASGPPAPPRCPPAPTDLP